MDSPDSQLSNGTTFESLEWIFAANFCYSHATETRVVPKNSPRLGLHNGTVLEQIWPLLYDLVFPLQSSKDSSHPHPNLTARIWPVVFPKEETWILQHPEYWVYDHVTGTIRILQASGVQWSKSHVCSMSGSCSNRLWGFFQYTQ